MFTDMANNRLTLLDEVIIPTLRNTIYPHRGNIVAMKWDFDENGAERQRIKIMFTDDSEKWKDASQVVKLNHEI